MTAVVFEEAWFEEEPGGTLAQRLHKQKQGKE